MLSYQGEEVLFQKIRRSGLAAIGVTLLEEVCHWGLGF